MSCQLYPHHTERDDMSIGKVSAKHGKSQALLNFIEFLLHSAIEK